MAELKIYVGDNAPPIKERIKKSFYLENSSWDDYSYRTSYNLYYIDKDKELENIGGIKIAKEKLEHLVRPLSNGYIEGGIEEFFSLGQDKSFYSALRKLPNNLGSQFLSFMNDISFERNLWVKNYKSKVVKDSLLRFISTMDVIDFQRVFSGEDSKLDYCFSICNEELVNFNVDHSLPFKNSNIHAVIGNNGVGKTTFLKKIVTDIINQNFECKIISKIDSENIYEGIDIDYIDEALFVSFSAFDNNIPDVKDNDRFTYLGLHDGEGGFKSPEVLTDEFTKSLDNLVNNKDIEYISKVLEPLKNVDYLDVHIDTFIQNIEDKDGIVKLYKDLSSGHRIVLHTLVLLMDSMQQGVVTLFDEPETHLHPPLLGAFLQSLQIICDKYNGLLIFATHSPIILQEVLTENVLVLRRAEEQVVCKRTGVVTYGQNVSKLTRTAFGYQNVGFHKTIRELVENGELTKENIAEYEQIGTEAVKVAWAQLYEAEDV